MGDFVILADKNSNAWGFAQKIQSYTKIEKGMDVPLYELEVDKFRNGEIGLHISENLRKKEIYFIHDSTKDPQQWWTELLLLKDLVLSSSAKSLILVLPNMLYSRQDRKDRPHVPISARALATSIFPGVERIITMDLHADQIQGFYPQDVPLDNLYSFPEAVRYLKAHHSEYLKNLVVVSPDAGSAKRAKKFIAALNKANEKDQTKESYDFAIIDKERQKAGEVSQMQLVGSVKGKNCLIPDDIIDTGGTLCSAAKILKENGAEKILCYTTHGIFTNGTDELKKHFDVVMTSNTHCIEKPGVEIVDVSSLFAEAIYRAQFGLSISKLFD
ncbi:MAG: ribose-phosphate pyrophosphokinase [Nanoarchaeota archaeon]